MTPLQSPSIELLAPALAQAQAEMHNAAKSSTNPHLESKYADLSSVRAACIGPLTAHGLSVTQTFVPHVGEHVSFERVEIKKEYKGRECTYREFRIPVQVLGYLRTQITHSSGQWIASELPVATVWGDPHLLGAAITYLRRYSLSAIAGISADDDDAQSLKDGMRNQSRGNQRPDPPPTRGRTNNQSNGYTSPPHAPAHAPTQAPATPEVPAPVERRPATAGLTPGNGVAAHSNGESLSHGNDVGRIGNPSHTTPSVSPSTTASRPGSEDSKGRGGARVYGQAAAKASSRPRTGEDLYYYAIENEVDPCLAKWISNSFVALGHPENILDWSPGQVSDAWPSIREHLVTVRSRMKASA